MRKLLCVLLAAILIPAAVACSYKSTSTTTTTTTDENGVTHSVTTTETYDNGVVTTTTEETTGTAEEATVPTCKELAEDGEIHSIKFNMENTSGLALDGLYFVPSGEDWPDANNIIAEGGIEAWTAETGAVPVILSYNSDHLVWDFIVSYNDGAEKISFRELDFSNINSEGGFTLTISENEDGTLRISG